MAIKKKGLGKGLDALLGDAFGAAAKEQSVKTAGASTSNNLAARNLASELSQLSGGSEATAGAQKASQQLENNTNQPQLKTDTLLEVPVEMCQRGKYQPRRDIDPTSLEELAASIRNQGVMQPIILRAIASESAAQASYEIIAGERRWRAAQLAGLTTVPAVVKDVPDEAAMAMALVENLQREDLNVMEEAYALSRLNQEFDLTHQQVADIVGKSRATVSNTLRLMSLHKEVKLLLENGDLEMGHARALLALDGPDQVAAAKDVVNRGLSVRQTEALVKSTQSPKPTKSDQLGAEDPNISRLQNDLSETLGVPVAFNHSANGKGKLTIKYNSLDELDGILDHIK